MHFCCLWIFFLLTFSKKSFRNTIRVSNSLDPDQARHFSRSDLGPSSGSKLFAKVISRRQKSPLGGKSYLSSQENKDRHFIVKPARIYIKCQALFSLKIIRIIK